MSAVEKAHLRELATVFLHEKNFIGAQGFRLTNFMRVSIAVQACLVIFELGLNCLNAWKDIIVYAGPFRVIRETEDTIGVIHRETQILSGESWLEGPIVLSWADIQLEMTECSNGRNVVIHEIAHKLDGLNGSTNGYPPLHYGMSVPQWTSALSNAYEKLVQNTGIQNEEDLAEYAATNPAEFFAVASEYFFCSPSRLYKQFPEAYSQLRLYYRQHPLQRMQPEYHRKIRLW